MSFFGAPPKTESCRPEPSDVRTYFETVRREDNLREHREDDPEGGLQPQVDAVGPLHVQRRTTLDPAAMRDAEAYASLKVQLAQERRQNKRMEFEIRTLRQQVEAYMRYGHDDGPDDDSYARETALAGAGVHTGQAQLTFEHQNQADAKTSLPYRGGINLRPHEHRAPSTAASSSSRASSAASSYPVNGII